MDDAAKAQEETLAFLADAATYGGKGDKVRRIDTHAATVFLAGDRALKIKRAVRFPFLDYSTLATRSAAPAPPRTTQRRSSMPRHGSKRSVPTSTNISRRLPSSRRFFRPRTSRHSPQKAALTTDASCRCYASAAGAGSFATSTAIFTSQISC